MTGMEEVGAGSRTGVVGKALTEFLSFLFTILSFIARGMEVGDTGYEWGSGLVYIID